MSFVHSYDRNLKLSDPMINHLLKFYNQKYSSGFTMSVMSNTWSSQIESFFFKDSCQIFIGYPVN